MAIHCGIDGCANGWLAMYRDNSTARVWWQVLPDFSALLGWMPALDLVAIDIPIGQPDDLLDAFAALWKVERVELGAAWRVLEEKVRDGNGLAISRLTNHPWTSNKSACPSPSRPVLVCMANACRIRGQWLLAVPKPEPRV